MAVQKKSVISSREPQAATTTRETSTAIGEPKTLKATALKKNNLAARTLSARSLAARSLSARNMSARSLKKQQ